MTPFVSGSPPKPAARPGRWSTPWPGGRPNRNGLIVDALATRACGHAERLAALPLVEPHADRPQTVTLGSDKGFDTRDFVAELREINVTPHLAQNASGRRSAIDGRTTRHPGYAISQRIRKRIEEAFGTETLVAELVLVQRRIGEQWDERTRKEVHSASMKRARYEEDLRAAPRASITERFSRAPGR